MIPLRTRYQHIHNAKNIIIVDITLKRHAIIANDIKCKRQTPKQIKPLLSGREQQLVEGTRTHT